MEHLEPDPSSHAHHAVGSTAQSAADASQGEHPAGHGRHAAGHDRHAGHSVAMFRDKFWLSLALTIPVDPAQRGHPGVVRLHGPGDPGHRVRARDPRHDHLPVRRTGLHPRRPGRAGRSPARDDDPDLARDHRRLRDLLGRHARGVRGRDLVGAGDPDHDHAARPLARDALDRPGAGRAVGPCRAPAGYGRAGHRRMAPRRCRSARCRSTTIVLVRPGARVPADGDIVDGDCRRRRIDDHRRVTSGPQADRRSASSRARWPPAASLRVKVTAIGEQTALSGIMRMVAEAQASASRAQALADRAAAILFYVALAAGAITLVVWWLLGDPEGALVRTATVLVIACPHALGLAIPLVIAISTSHRRAERAAGQGSPRARARPDGRHRDLRQDRDPHQGGACPGRRGGRLDGRRARPRGSPPRSRPTPSIHSRERSSRAPAARRRDPVGHRLRGAGRSRRARPVRRPSSRSSAGPGSCRPGLSAAPAGRRLGPAGTDRPARRRRRRGRRRRRRRRRDPPGVEGGDR